MGPAAPRHVGSSQNRARTRVPCIGRRTLNHCATREALKLFLGSERYTVKTESPSYSYLTVTLPTVATRTASFLFLSKGPRNFPAHFKESMISKTGVEENLSEHYLKLKGKYELVPQRADDLAKMFFDKSSSFLGILFPLYSYLSKRQTKDYGLK